MHQQAALEAIGSLQSALRARKRAAVNDACRRLIEGRAELGKQWKAIVGALLHNGELTLAQSAMEVWVEQSGNDPHVRYEQAALGAQVGQLGRAEQLLHAIGPDVPDVASNAYLHGTIATNLGRLDEARAHLRRAAHANPHSGQIWLALMKVGPDESDAKAALAAEPAMQAAPAPERAAYCYALGNLHAARGDPPAAFAKFEAGAKLAGEFRPYDARTDRRDADTVRSDWTSEAIEHAARPEERSGTGRPIFVAGLPRSGTTLVEQILASHSEVDGGDELGLLRLVEQDIRGTSPARIEQYVQTGGSVEALRDLHDHLLSERFPGNGRVVDKTLSASRQMGLIAILYPHAPIIWVRRDPLDCAWSAFRTWFARGVNWSFSLEAIAEHFQLEDALHRHWSGVLGDRILTVEYRALVEQPERQIERIADHCGLPFELSMVRPHETARAVTTASVTQVREPINRKGLGAAAPYRKFLQPFVDAYSD